MTQFTKSLGRRLGGVSALALTVLVAATGTASAHGGGSYDGGMMGGGGGFLGGGMGLWGLLWMGLLLGVPLLVGYALLTRDGDGGTRRSSAPDRSAARLRERYARGELSDEEFDRRRQTLERTG